MLRRATSAETNASGGQTTRRRSMLSRALRWAGLAVGIAACAVAVAVALIWLQLGPLPLSRADALSVTVLDRDDRLLRAYTTADGRWRLPVEVKDVDPRYLAMLVAFEDKRFRSHRGIDPWAVGRAVWQLIGHQRIVSGGSTLTMQVARLLQGEHERTGAGKVRQALRAVALERRLSKDAILRLYLRMAPFGGNLEGVRAASLAYFGKEPRRLSLAEAALLVALPQSPEMRRPDRYTEAARRARNRVLDRAVAAGAISASDAERAKADRMPTVRREFPMLAPHLADAEVEQNKTRLVHRLTLDAQVQGNLEQLVREHAASMGGRLSAALLVVDHQTGEVIAHVGSPGYLDDGRFGAVDMTDAVRSPGSTLKPLIYGLAFEAGLAHPETLIEDGPVRFGLYVPKNFDQGWHGTVSVRMALAQSLNIPAVKVLDAVGPAKLHGRLQQVGLTPVLPKGAEPSAGPRAGWPGLKAVRLGRAVRGAGAGRRADCAYAPARGSRTQRRRPAAHACWRRSRPGTSRISCATRRRRPTPSPARSPTRRGPPTASAMPGRSATTGATPSPCGSAGPTVPQRPGWPAASRQPRSCSMRSPA